MAKLNLKLFKETADELNKKLEEDPYRAGTKHKDLYPDEVSEMMELLFWAKGMRELTLKIKPSSTDGVLLDVEIINRK
jgi:hypothetical protein